MFCNRVRLFIFLLQHVKIVQHQMVLDRIRGNTGTTLYVPNIVRPTLTKSVNPTTARPGDVVTWDINVNVQANAVDIYDETVIDRLPDGLTSFAPVSVLCTSGPCPSIVPIGIIDPPVSPVTGDRSSYAGWWIGDIPAGTSFQFTIRYTTTVESFLDDGKPIIDGQVGEPFKNRAILYYNTKDTYVDSNDVSSFLNNANTQWNGKTVLSQAELDIVTPSVVIEKTVTNKQTWDWTDKTSQEHTTYVANVGDTIEYQLKVCNTGSITAYNIDLSDNMGAGDLLNVVIDPSAATITDGWSIADPAVIWNLPSLASGDCKLITYSGTTLDSAHLVQVATLPQ